MASDDELLAACRAACVDEFLDRIGGLDGELGQGGAGVSGGQKQRLCIARTLLKHPRVLIFDDSTSAVDMATDAKIREHIARIPDATVLIIAQRIASVMDADRIVVLDDGRVHGVGTHEELLAGDNIYQEIYASQMEFAGDTRDAGDGNDDGCANDPFSSVPGRIVPWKGVSAMPKTAAQARPADLQVALLRRLLSYMGHAKFSLLAVGVLASVAAIASLAGTYMVRPIVNGLATGGEELLAKQVILTAIIYAAGVLSALGYSQIMVRAAQRVVSDIRRDLFAHIQTLPLSYFDSTRSGDIMSFFTNDVDTVSEALNNSFANVIQAAIQVAGTTAMLIILNWQLTIITLVCDAAIVLYARYSGARSKRFFAAQQASLGDLDGYIEEMVSGQKVIKVFNREAANVAGFACRNDELCRTGTAAVSYANSMVPMTVVIGYVNYAIVAVAGGMLCIKGLADVGALASYLVFVRQAAMPINQFTQLGNFLLNALAGAERLFAAMDLKPEVDEGCVELVQTGDAAWAWKIPEGQGVGVVRAPA